MIHVFNQTKNVPSWACEQAQVSEQLFVGIRVNMEPAWQWPHIDPNPYK